MKMSALLRRDIILGSFQNRFKFIIVPILSTIIIISLNNYLEYALAECFIFQKGTSMDYLLYVMKGMNVYQFDPEGFFDVPVYWFLFQLGIAYIIAYYPEQDFREFGIKIFLATGSRVKWWLSKCIWILCTVGVYFGLMILCVFVEAHLSGAEVSWKFSEEVSRFLFTDNMLYLEYKEAWLISIILPCLMTMALSLLQILFSFLLTPVVSFALICCIYILSAYNTTWLLPGNFTMWLRSSYVSVEGLSPKSGVFLAIFFIITTVLFGIIYFDSCDIS